MQVKQMQKVNRGAAMRRNPMSMTLAISKWSFLAVALTSVVWLNCTIDRSGLGRTPVLIVEPTLVCPGDPVRVSWDMTRELLQESCECPNGGYDSIISCVSSSDCTGGDCRDGVCYSTECGGGTFDPAGCLAPNLSVTLSSTPTPLDPPVVDSREDPGSRTIFPEQTTTVTFENGWYWPPVSTFAIIDRTVSVVDFQPSRSVRFESACNAWIGQTFPWGAPRFYDLQQVVSITNPGPYNIIVHKDGASAPIASRSGGGPFLVGERFAGIWSAEIDDPARQGLLPPRCGVLRLNEYPPITITVELECRVEED